MRQCSLHCFPFFLLCIRCTRPSWFYYRNEKKTVVSNLHSLSHRAHTYIETLTLIHLMQHPANCIKLSCCMFSIWNLNYIVFFNPFFPAIFISVQLVCWVRVLCACFSIQIALFSVFFIMRTFTNMHVYLYGFQQSYKFKLSLCVWFDWYAPLLWCLIRVTHQHHTVHCFRCGKTTQ